MASTLLLNASYEPLKVISWERAVTLAYLGKVDVVETYEAVIKGVNVTIQMPSVVRLRRYTKHERRVRFSRNNIYRRDNFACQYCGATPDPVKLTLDHVVPRAHGGRTEWTNIVTACVPCNARKADRTPEQARMSLPRPPVRPGAMSIVAPNEAPHPSWLGYLGSA